MDLKQSGRDRWASAQQLCESTITLTLGSSKALCLRLAFTHVSEVSSHHSPKHLKMVSPQQHTKSLGGIPIYHVCFFNTHPSYKGITGYHSLVYHLGQNTLGRNCARFQRLRLPQLGPKESRRRGEIGSLSTPSLMHQPSVPSGHPWTLDTPSKNPCMEVSGATCM